MKLRNINYFFKEAFISLVRNRWMSLASIGAVAAALIITGSFLLMSVNFNYVLQDVESQVEITAYLKNSVKEEAIYPMKSQILSFDGVKEVKFVSRQEALEDFKKQVGEDLLEGIKNPLPDQFRIKVKDPQDIARIAKEIEKFEEVDEVKYGKGVVEKLFKIINWLRYVGVIIMVVFAAISVFIISNTIRLTVFARRKEINIMKYIGATDWFVRWPFLIEGMTLGLIGSAIAVLLLAVGYKYIYNTVKLNVPMISLIPINEFTNYAYMFLAIGMFIGAFGSSFSMKRFLHV